MDICICNPSQHSPAVLLYLSATVGESTFSLPTVARALMETKCKQVFKRVCARGGTALCITKACIVLQLWILRINADTSLQKHFFY